MIREGFWKSSLEPELPMPVADNTWTDHEVFLRLLFLVEAQLAAPDNPNKGQCVHYRGWSQCRCCEKPNGSSEYAYSGYVWPSGFQHYIQAHRVKPSDGFIQMISKAALVLSSDQVEFKLDNSASANIVNAVAVAYRNANIVALNIDTKIKRVKITGTGSSNEVPTVFLDLNDGDDGDDDCIAFPQFKGWSVFAAQRVKYGAHVVLINNEQEEENNGDA